MTYSLDALINVKIAPSNFTIKLPTGATASISHIGDIMLPNGLQLLNVLHIPGFNHNLLSFHKLARDAKCDVIFQPNRCMTIKPRTNTGVLRQAVHLIKRLPSAVLNFRTPYEKLHEEAATYDHLKSVHHLLYFNPLLKLLIALRALRGLVKLQALVRGHIVRKQIAERLLQMQAALRARTRAGALRTQIYESSQSAIKPCHINFLGPATPENYEPDVRRSRSSKHEQSVMQKRNESISSFRVGPDKENLKYHYNTDEEAYNRVLSHRRSFTTLKDSTLHQPIFSPSSGEDQSLAPLKFTNNVDEASVYAAQTSLKLISTKRASLTRSGPFTPTLRNISGSCKSGYSDYYPSYMSYTESSKAKVRSLSSPRQNTQLERSNTAKRFPSHGGYCTMKSSGTQNSPSTLHSNFTSKAYPGSGRLDRVGMPLGSNGVGFSGGLLSSY
ncbi:protein IQ-DOMAIN 22-like [Apium graveolens]|uniref:protein IQ-DOMAIN 22-like n=1 Tax=Apium graveolens TaxID=4045 RepID=UPI003D79CFA7